MVNIDEEVRRRLRDVEDHFTERKESPQEHTMREAITALANTAIPEKPGIIYVGVKNDGTIIGGDNMDSWQQKISSWAVSCFPPVNVVPVALTVDGKNILAVVVPGSSARPHFAKAAYIRKGARNEMANQAEVDEWIAYRNSKVKMILDWKDRVVGLTGPNNRRLWQGQHKVINCNQFFVTLQSEGSTTKWTHPLAAIELKLNDTYTPNPSQLLLLLYEFGPDAPRR
jgi:hypothetical protein